MRPDSYRQRADGLDAYSESGEQEVCDYDRGSIGVKANGASVVQIENMGRGVYAVLVGGVILSALVSAVALSTADNVKERLREEQQQRKADDAEIIGSLQAENAALRSRFEETKTEARMLEYYVLELDGKLMAGGFTPPSRGYGNWKQEKRK